MFARTLFISVLAAVASVSAAPTNTTTFEKRAVTTVNQCVNSGQVALTFDGKYMIARWIIDLIY
jgi:hypothetical protein